MFGLGFWEMVVVGIVLIVVVGPKELPNLLRSVGKGISKLKNMSTDLREQSGIDRVLRDEGLHKDIETIRSLSRGNIVGSLVNQVTKPLPRRRPTEPEETGPIDGVPPPPEKEYPELGCDSYDAIDELEPPALPANGEAKPEEEAKPPEDPKPEEPAQAEERA